MTWPSVTIEQYNTFSSSPDVLIHEKYEKYREDIGLFGI